MSRHRVLIVGLACLLERASNGLAHWVSVAGRQALRPPTDEPVDERVRLYKTELINHPDRTHAWTGRAEVERETASWVHWYNTTRIHHSLGKMSPTEFEEHYRLANPASIDEVA